MKKYLVISYYDGNIDIDVIKNTYEEAKEYMDNDVKEFILPMKLEDVDESVCWIENCSAFADCGEPCEWAIKCIDI